MASPRYDFHIHTKYLGCGNATMEIPAIVRECERLGVTCLGITDHLNSLDKLELHTPIRRDIETLQTDIEVYFGVELNFTGCDQGFPFSEAIQEQTGFQFAIGGIHSAYLQQYDAQKLVKIQHRHHLATCRDPLVQVLVHPYWFPKGEFEAGGWPTFDSMRLVPERFVRELGQTARETNTAIEINGAAVLSSPHSSKSFLEEYVEFLSILAEEGVVFSVGSDSYDLSHFATIEDTWEAVDRLHLSPDRVWRPEGKPMIGRNSSEGKDI